MARAIDAKTAVKMLLYLALASLAAVLGPRAGLAMLASDRPELWFRLLAVLVALLGVVPWMAAVLWGLRFADEYQRQIYAVGLVIAFCGAILLFATLDWLKRAGLVAPDLPGLVGSVWPALILPWFAGNVASGLYHRYRR